VAQCADIYKIYSLYRQESAKPWAYQALQWLQADRMGELRLDRNWFENFQNAANNNG
jgi:hypothetical protein